MRADNLVEGRPCARRGRVGRRAGAACLAALVLGACGGATGGAAPTTQRSAATETATPRASAAGAASLTACQIVTAADVAAATGTAVGDRTPTSGPSQNISLCRYSEVGLLVRFSPTIGRQEAAANKSGHDITAVAGLGDEAYWFYDDSAGVRQIVFSVVKGSAQLYMVSTGLKTTQPYEELARRALPRM
ncbi:MAG TPA: hypothetical protein VLW53_01755 [Candidatus Eisenbacteria bacterium]|nr:hypothetical protein [Candidatus Eisenbacteria bacterium]